MNNLKEYQVIIGAIIIAIAIIIAGNTIANVILHKIF